MPTYSGPSTAATGTITANTASLLTLAKHCTRGLVTNVSGQRAYFKIDDAASPTVSTTVYDFSLADGDSLSWDDQAIKNMSVYVNATSGIRVVGW